MSYPVATMITSTQEPTPCIFPILSVNSGSSSIKFAIYQCDDSFSRSLYGKIDRIGLKDASFEFDDSIKNQRCSRAIEANNSGDATKFLIEWLDEQIGLQTIAAIGHRIVHGMHHTAPELITQELIDELRRIVPCDPQHLPSEIDLIEAFRARVPEMPQVACFDTGFHATMPRVAKLLAIPRRLHQKGIQRYGFHGLSYEYVMQELARVGDPVANNGCLLLAHLGNGASLAAVCGGKSIDTSMGFTPAAGLPMSTRSGDLDPGIVGYLARTERMSIAEFDQMANHESGLLGVSETSSDMRDLIAKESTDIRAADAVELFCYQTKKWIGAFVAALGGLQTLVFTGGIGENCPSVRYRICAGLNCLGIDIDKSRNNVNAQVISSTSSRVTVRVIPTNEEQMIARAVHRLIGADYVKS
jgi:acetate kinase